MATSDVTDPPAARCGACNNELPAADAECATCGMRMPGCGCVYLKGARRVTCVDHLEREAPTNTDAAGPEPTPGQAAPPAGSQWISPEPEPIPKAPPPETPLERQQRLKAERKAAQAARAAGGEASLSTLQRRAWLFMVGALVAGLASGVAIGVAVFDEPPPARTLHPACAQSVTVAEQIFDTLQDEDDSSNRWVAALRNGKTDDAAKHARDVTRIRSARKQLVGIYTALGKECAASGKPFIE